jgi:hypothetical protein
LKSLGEASAYCYTPSIFLRNSTSLVKRRLHATANMASEGGGDANDPPLPSCPEAVRKQEEGRDHAKLPFCGTLSDKARKHMPLFLDKYWLQMLSCLWIRLIPASALDSAELGVEICVKARRFWSYVVQAHNLFLGIDNRRNAKVHYTIAYTKHEAGDMAGAIVSVREAVRISTNHGATDASTQAAVDLLRILEGRAFRKLQESDR